MSHEIKTCMFISQQKYTTKILKLVNILNGKSTRTTRHIILPNSNSNQVGESITSQSSCPDFKWSKTLSHPRVLDMSLCVSLLFLKCVYLFLVYSYYVKRPSIKDRLSFICTHAIFKITITTKYSSKTEVMS